MKEEQMVEYLRQQFPNVPDWMVWLSLHPEVTAILLTLWLLLMARCAVLAVIYLVRIQKQLTVLTVVSWRWEKVQEVNGVLPPASVDPDARYHPTGIPR